MLVLLFVLVLLQIVEACWIGPAHWLAARRTLSKPHVPALMNWWKLCGAFGTCAPLLRHRGHELESLFTSRLNESLNHLNTSLMFDKERFLCGNKCFFGLVHSHRQAKRLLSEIVEQCRYGPGFHSDMDGNSSIQQILIPANKVGLVIGKGGETIKQLQV